MTNLDSIFKSRDITLPTKVHLAKAMVFPVVVYGCESWTVKKAEHRRIDAFELWCWRRLLRVPWTAKRSNQSIHDYWKNHSLTRRTFVGKEMSLLFNMLSRLVITFLPRSKRLLISWLHHHLQLFWSQIKSATVSTVSPSICREVMGPDAMILVF